MGKVEVLRIFFIRHGQTENFIKPPFNGWTDASLTDEGKKQMNDMAESLSKLEFDAVYSSDLSRSFYGAQALAEKLGLPLISDPKWREINFGQWDGLTYEQIVAKDEETIYKIFSSEGSDINFPGGESSISFTQRIKDALDDLWLKHPSGGRVAVVCHGGVCKALWAIVLNISPHIAWASIRQDFAAVNVADIYKSGECVAHLINAYVGPEGYHSPGPGLERLRGSKVLYR